MSLLVEQTAPVTALTFTHCRSALSMSTNPLPTFKYSRSASTAETPEGESEKSKLITPWLSRMFTTETWQALPPCLHVIAGTLLAESSVYSPLSPG